MPEPIAPHVEAAYWFLLYHRTQASEALAESNRASAKRHLDIADFFGRFIYRKAA